MSHDRILDGLRVICTPGTVHELRTIRKTPGRPIIGSGYFDDLEGLAEAAARCDAGGAQVYLTINPVTPALIGRNRNRVTVPAGQTTNDTEIERRHWIFVDCDPVRPAETSSTAEEHARALDVAARVQMWLIEHDVDPQSIVLASSGNGAHVLVRCDLEVTEETRVLHARILQALDWHFTDDAVKVDQKTFNASRITKIYGTVAKKGEDTIERPHRLSRIIEQPGEIVPASRESLERIAADLPERGATGRRGGMGTEVGVFDVQGFIDRHPELRDAVTRSGPWQGGYRWELNPCPFCAEHTDFSAWIAQHPSGAPDAGCHHNSCHGNRWQQLRAMFEPKGSHPGGLVPAERIEREELTEPAGVMAPGAVGAARENPAGDAQPHNASPETERALIAELLARGDGAESAVAIVTPDAFTVALYGGIFEAICTLVDAADPVDVTTVAAQLAPRLTALGGQGVLERLRDTAEGSGNVTAYARIIANHAIMRRIAEAGEAIRKLSASPLDAHEALSRADGILSAIAAGTPTDGFVRLGDILPEVFARLEAIQGMPNGMTGVSTGYEDLDRLTSGWQPSDLIVLAGRPRMAKTALLVNMAHTLAVRHGIPVGLFSIEMSRSQLAQRLLAIDAEVEAKLFRSGRVSENEWTAIARSMDRLERAPIWIDDSSVLTAIDMRAKGKKLRGEQGAAWFGIDYIQIMTPSRANNRQEEITQLARACKQFARELEVPLVALSQLSRKPDDRPDHRPQLSDLRESGSIEQESDLVIGLYRDVVYNPDTAFPGTAELIVLKHRHGPPGTVSLHFDESLMKFANIDWKSSALEADMHAA